MAIWAIGDIQGCHDELVRLIEKIKFDPSNDRLWFCGDLVNRGGQSLAVLRHVKSFGDRAIVALGNHDLSLLAVAERKREDQARVNPELREVLFAPDRDELLDWLRQCSLLHIDRSLNFMLVHAGFFPRWTTEQAIEAAREVEERLRGEGYRRLLKQLFGNKPDMWNPKLRGIDRLRASINVFTRMRYCDVRGRIAFGEKGAPGTQRPGSIRGTKFPASTNATFALYADTGRRSADSRARRLRDRHRLRLGRMAHRAETRRR